MATSICRAWSRREVGTEPLQGRARDVGVDEESDAAEHGEDGPGDVVDDLHRDGQAERESDRRPDAAA
jgi:hypothetical protein